MARGRALRAVPRAPSRYRDLGARRVRAVVQMLAEGFTTRRGRRGAYLHHDAVHGRAPRPRGARLAAVTSGGAIPDTADYHVVLEPQGAHRRHGQRGLRDRESRRRRLPARQHLVAHPPGRARARCASRTRRARRRASRSGSARRRRAPRSCRARVAPARGRSRPRWIAAGATRRAEWLVQERRARPSGRASRSSTTSPPARGALGALPTHEHLVLERFFDESGGMQLVVHAPFGSRINRAWGLALRKRFCRKFNFELQAAATEDAIVLSLGPTHSFPLAEVARYLHPRRRSRTCSSRRCSTRRCSSRAGAGTPTRRARAACASAAAARCRRSSSACEAEDLLAAVFPDQLACAENLVGEREIPDHPLVSQTIADCLHEAMDVDGPRAPPCAASSAARSRLRRARPHRALAARRTRSSRRGPTPSSTTRRWKSAAPRPCWRAAGSTRRRPRDLGQARPRRDRARARRGLAGTAQRRRAARCAHEPRLPHRRRRSSAEWRAFARRCSPQRRRATRLSLGARADCGSRRSACREFGAAFPGATPTPAIEAPAEHRKAWTREAALVEIVRGRLAGPRPRDRGGARRRRSALPAADDRGRARRSSKREGFGPARALHAGCRGAANGASGGSSRASTAIRWTGCGARSSRSSRAISCASSSAGSGSRPKRGSRAPMRSPPSSRSSRASRHRPRRGRPRSCRRA